MWILKDFGQLRLTLSAALYGGLHPTYWNRHMMPLNRHQIPVRTLSEQQASQAEKQSKLQQERTERAERLANRQHRNIDPLVAQERSRKANEAKRRKADAAYLPILPLLRELRNEQHLTLMEISKELRRRGIRSRTGVWITDETIRRILKRDRESQVADMFASFNQR